MTVLVTGVGLALPDGATPADPAATLGQKGLRYKDRATCLGMAATSHALDAAGLAGDRPVPDDSTGVVVSTNFGNAETVCRAAVTIGAAGSRELRPMDVPNASANITASEIAIRFSLRGPNLTLCNGATSGLDAVRWASTVLRARRADVMVVVGVEPGDDVMRELTGRTDVLDGAVALVLETERHARDRGAPVAAVLGRQVRRGDLAACSLELEAAGRAPSLVLAPGGESAQWGASSGALGVLRCAEAIGHFVAGVTGEIHAFAGGDDAVAAVALSADT